MCDGVCVGGGGSGGLRRFCGYTDELKRKMSYSGTGLARLYIVHTIDRMDRILTRYKCQKYRRGEGTWTYYKRIPSRYWHEMMDAYTAFMDVLNGKCGNVEWRDGSREDGGSGSGIGGGSGRHIKQLWFCYEDKLKIQLYVRLLRAVAQFDKCRKGKFGLCRRIVYDYMPCLVR